MKNVFLNHIFPFSIIFLENKLKTLESSPNFVDNPEYAETNEKLDKIYQETTNGISIRTKCD